jgi:adenine-specific DNA-methyltransferase
MPTLDWLHRDAAFRTADAVPYRLIEAVGTHGDGDPGNLLLQGDNLEALKALLPFYRGQVKCIFIDPPYNTQSAFEHYDDNLEHSQWLSLMLPRLQLLRDFLRPDGSIWVTIDDNEGHYLKVLMDEVFGRRNFVATAIWQKLHARNNSAQHLSADHDFLLAYAQDLPRWRRNKVERTAASDADFWNPDDDPRGVWRRSDLTAAKPYSDGHYEVIGPHGDLFTPRTNRFWSISRETFADLRADNRIWWGKTGRTFPFRKRFKSELGELVPTTIWLNEEVGNNREAKQEITRVFGRDDIFGTPKPERLLQRILHIATNPGDLVLDSFLGSGTTAAVAHKMGRRWIGIEMGEHAVTHCLPRLQKVIDGEGGGISAAVGWQGGGGFRFARLGEAIFGADGQINPQVRFAALAAFVWQQATRSAYAGALPGALPGTPRLGVHEGQAVYLLYNGILGDRRPAGGNVLTLSVLQALKASCWHEGPKTIYGEACRLGPARLAAEGIVFRQIPYELNAR